MPSLYGTTVAANYGRMTPQNTYGVGEPYTQFGTRQIQIIKVLVSGSTTDMTTANGATGSYQDSNSLFSLAVRSLQQFMEIYAVYTPVAGGFLAVVSFDTANTADSQNGSTATVVNFANNGLAEASVKAAIDAAASTTSTVTITAPTIAIGTTL